MAPRPQMVGLGRSWPCMTSPQFSRCRSTACSSCSPGHDMRWLLIQSDHLEEEEAQPHAPGFTIEPCHPSAVGFQTLAERAVLLHRLFPEVKVSPSTICKLYRAHGIRKKAIVVVKVLRGLQRQRLEAKLILMQSELLAALEEKRTIVFVDQCMFAVSTVAASAYSVRKSTVTVMVPVAYQNALAVVGEVSSNGGVEGYLIQPMSIDSTCFIKFVENLMQRDPERKLALFMDNCSIHHSRKVKAYLNEN